MTMRTFLPFAVGLGRNVRHRADLNCSFTDPPGFVPGPCAVEKPVPTDMRKNRGRCGVWLTSALTPNGHGLFGSVADKTAIRLTVEVADDARLLFRWPDWALTNATADTISILQNANGDQDETWFVYFGVLPPSAIVECVNSENGTTIHEWPNIEETPLDAPAVPAWRRDAWHKNLLKKVQKALRQT